MLPALIGGGAALLGGIMGNRSNKKINRENNANQRYINKQNIDMQYDFAKNSIQWKTQDAKNSGIHPLYALGAQSMSPTIAAQAPSLQSDNSLGNAIANAGNAISGSMQKKQDQINQQEFNDLQKIKLKAEISETLARTKAIAEEAKINGNVRAYQQLNQLRPTPNINQTPTKGATLPGHEGVKAEELTTPNLVAPFGVNIPVPKGRTNLATVEDTYDAIVSMLWGVGSFAESMYIKNQNNPARIKRRKNFKENYNKIKKTYHSKDTMWR